MANTVSTKCLDNVMPVQIITARENSSERKPISKYDRPIIVALFLVFKPFEMDWFAKVYILIAI